MILGRENVSLPKVSGIRKTLSIGRRTLADKISARLCKRLFNSKSGVLVRNCKKKTVEWNFSNLEISIVFNLSKIYSTEFFFLIFPVSSYVCNKKIYIYM